jgi:hypothetical protein
VLYRPSTLEITLFDHKVLRQRRTLWLEEDLLSRLGNGINLQPSLLSAVLILLFTLTGRKRIKQLEASSAE